MSKRKRTKRILVDMSLVAWLGLGLGFSYKLHVFFYIFMLEMDTINVS